MKHVDLTVSLALLSFMLFQFWLAANTRFPVVGGAWLGLVGSYFLGVTSFWLWLYGWHRRNLQVKT